MTIQFFCPNCKQSLMPREGSATGLYCKQCDATFESYRGIPLLGNEIPKNTKEYWEYRPATGGVEHYLLEFLPDGAVYERVLDLGCGDGRSTIPIQPHANVVYGLDSALHYMAHLEAMHFENVGLVNGDAKNIPFPDTFFDLIISISVVEHIPPHDMQQVFREAFRVLQPGGTFLVRNDSWFYHVLELLRIRPGQIGRTPDSTHINMMTGGAFAAALRAAGFTIVREDHFPFYRFEKKWGMHVPRFIARLFATHSNFICTKQ